MALLVDFSQIFIGSYMTSAKYGDVSMDVLRPSVLNTLRLYRNKFTKEYGELVLCCDSPKSWRKDIFPNYKASRRKAKSVSSDVDWQDLYDCLNLMKSELTKWFPYKVLQVEGAEADDIIAVLVKDVNERTLILSSDKDLYNYINLMLDNIHQYRKNL